MLNTKLTELTVKQAIRLGFGLYLAVGLDHFLVRTYEGSRLEKWQNKQRDDRRSK